MTDPSLSERDGVDPDRRLRRFQFLSCFAAIVFVISAASALARWTHPH